MKRTRAKDEKEVIQLTPETPTPIHFGLSNGSNTAAYEASGSSGTARQEGVAVSLVYIGEIECAPPPAAVQRSTPPPNYFKTFKLFQNFRAFRAFDIFLTLVTLSWRGSAILYWG